MDIKPGAREERRRKLEDMYRLQKWHVLLHEDAIRAQECRCYLSKTGGYNFPILNWEEPRGDQHEVEPQKMFVWGYMVTSEGIQANPKKTKAITDMKSPRTLKEMQSLSGKLAALKRFLFRSAKKSLPFFKTLKDITKENKDEYRKIGNDLRIPGSGNRGRKCRIASRKKGVQCLIHHVSMTLNEAKRNYSPLEKLPLSLLHMYRRLRRYFEAHPIKDITDQPFKQILNKAQASGRHAKYSVELGAYNITYEPRSAMKGQVLANFLSEAPTGTPTKEFFQLPAKWPNKDDMERWTLFTDEASNSKGSGGSLVLISPSGVEFTYAVRLNFASTNNKAEYEALLAGLRMARKMKVQNIDVKVDLKQKEVGAIVEEEEEDNWMTPIIRQQRHPGDPHRIMRNAHRCTCSGAEASQNVNDFNHGSVAILPMGNGHPRAPTASLWKIEIHHFMDNKTQFVNNPFKGRCESLNIKQMNTAVAHLPANGLVERANKSLMEGIKARLGRERA
nr:hypothetical protein [Tanacetum cinerariifolium]